MTAAAAVAAPKPTDVTEGEIVRMVRLEELEASPFNQRLIVEDDAMSGLVESIRNHGIQQPLLCREVPIEDEVVSYQIVAGHRRHFAAGLAGIEFAPVIFREMTDDEARQIQITENLQRAELPPLEEATAFNEAMTFHGGKMLSVQELAARLGKSPVYINRRLTLLYAIGAVQFALSHGLIEVGHALELARLSEFEQERLLVWLGVVKPNVGLIAAMEDDEDEDFDDEDEDFEDEEEDEEETTEREPEPTTRSVAELRRYIASTALRILGEAPFAPGDRLLSADAGSCLDCLKRTGASPLLFSDVRGDDICTDRDCYDDKVKAHVTQQIAQAKADKRKLLQLSGEWGRLPDGAIYQHNVEKVEGEPCGFAVDAIYVDGSNVGKVVKVCAEGTCKLHKGRYSSKSKPADPEKAKEERKKLLAKVKVEKAYRLQLFKECLAKPIDAVPTDEMVRALVRFAFTRLDNTKEPQFAEALGWDKGIFSWNGEKALAAKMITLTQADAIRIALVGLEANELAVHEQEIGQKRKLGLEEVAALIGVDAASVRAAVDPESVKPKPAAKKAAVKKTAAKKAAKKAPAKKAAAKKKAAKP